MEISSLLCVLFLQNGNSDRECVLIGGRTDELIKEGKYPDPARYYEFLHNKIILKFVPRNPDQMVKDEFQCVLAKNMKYEQVLFLQRLS
jgi:ICP0-binding domain of Ubiquitin-specific protease 7